jgi:uncharacterized repeat protein (TIGR03837 family)
MLQRMALRPTPPLWINLEYLSAEGYVERSHRLPSPQLAGPGAGLTKWFFYPGFTAATGGLLREPDLMARLEQFDASAWLHDRGLKREPDEQVVSLFCYDNASIPALLDELSLRPTLLLAAQGAAARQVTDALGPALRRGALRSLMLPPLTQRDYDHLLWASDLNFVRGEDSFVRAQWAGRPFVWQIYPQQDGAHAAKLEAFVQRLMSGADAELAQSVQRLHAVWNGLTAGALPRPAPGAWRHQVEQWRATLLAQQDLTTQLLNFVAEKS